MAEGLLFFGKKADFTTANSFGVSAGAINNRLDMGEM